MSKVIHIGEHPRLRERRLKRTSEKMGLLKVYGDVYRLVSRQLGEVSRYENEKPSEVERNIARLIGEENLRNLYEILEFAIRKTKEDLRRK